MKIEKRGKYPGVKVHLDDMECETILTALKPGGDGENIAVSFTQQLGKKINKLILDEPDLLTPRTPEQIQHELMVEFESAKLKLEAIALNKDWKEIHVK